MYQATYSLLFSLLEAFGISFYSNEDLEDEYDWDSEEADDWDDEDDWDSEEADDWDDDDDWYSEDNPL